MRKIGIIGLGHVGATLAYTLFTKAICDELILIDQNQAKVEAEYNDLHDALALNNSFVNVTLQDWDSLKDADIIVTAFGDIAKTVETGDRFGEFKFNAENAKKVGQKIKQIGFKGIILNISNPCDAISQILQKNSGLKENQVLGTGTLLDTARIKRIIAEKLIQDPHNVEGYVLGEHGASQFTAWSTVRVNNKIAVQLFSQENQEQISAESNQNSFKVAKGKGYTSYAVTAAAVKLIKAILSDARLYVPVSTYNPEFKTYIGYPAVIGRDGVEELIELKLTSEEKEKLTQSANKIKGYLKELA